MKFLKLFGMFFHKNILKSLSLLLISVSMCVIFSTTLANYNYYFKSISFFQKDEIIKADQVRIYDTFEWVYMDFMIGDQDGRYDMSEFNKDYQKFVDTDVYGQIKKLPAVENVYSCTVDGGGYTFYNNAKFQTICSDEPTYKLWDYSLSSGEWFWNTEESSEYPNVVLCGSIFENVDIGSDIDITLNTYHYKVHVIGKVAAPYHIIRFTYPSGSLDNMHNTIFVLRDNKTIDYFGKQILRYPDRAIVTYKESATDEEIEQCREFYKSFFINENPYLPFDLDEIIYELERSNTEISKPIKDMVEDEVEQVNRQIEFSLKKQLLVILIAAFMFMALSVLLVRKKQHDYYIYYFCGCSKRKTFLISLAGIATIAVVAGLVCTGYMMWRTYIISHGMVTGGDYQYIFDTTVYLAVWVYLALCVLLSCIIPFRMIFSKKSSLISLYRKGKE